MSDRALVGFLRAAVAAGSALAVAGSVMFVATGNAGSWWSEFLAIIGMFSVFFAIFVWLVIPQQPRNAVLWIMAAMGFFGGLYVAGWTGVGLLAVDDPNLVLGVATIPVDLSTAANWTIMVIEGTVTGAFFAMLTFGLLLFPDGRLHSPRWRWVAVLTAVGILTSVLGTAWSYRPGSTAETGPLADIGSVMVMLTAIMSLVALVVRFRRSSGTTRQQFKWVVWGASIFVPALIGMITFADTQYEELAFLPFMLGAVIFLGSYGIAVGKYRLYDVDVIISKTVVLGLLAAILAAIYVAVLVGVGALVGSGGEREIGLQVAATALVAIAFGPVRRWAQQWATRVVYGERATPYEVLARFSHRAAEASDDELVARIPRLIVDGTGAVAATLWVKSDEEFRRAATWPERAEGSAIPATESFDDPDSDFSLPVFHDGELLGGLSLVQTRGETLPPAEEQLVANLASGMGLALRNAALTSQLREQVAELEASRERILTAADEARRALEHDLDSGPQQQLVALKVMLGPTRKQAAQAGAAKTAEILAQLEAAAGDAIGAIREFSGGVYPPLLEAEGLRVAITQQTQKATLPATVEAHGLSRYPRDVEAAVYFTILEALQNTAKYADASTVSVVLQQTDDELSFEVTDNGIGFDPRTVAARSGLANMADRLDAVAGTWSLESSPGSGTIVRGNVPIGDRVSV